MYNGLLYRVMLYVYFKNPTAFSEVSLTLLGIRPASVKKALQFPPGPLKRGPIPFQVLHTVNKAPRKCRTNKRSLLSPSLCQAVIFSVGITFRAK